MFFHLIDVSLTLRLRPNANIIQVRERARRRHAQGRHRLGREELARRRADDGEAVALINEPYQVGRVRGDSVSTRTASAEEVKASEKAAKEAKKSPKKDKKSPKKAAAAEPSKRDLKKVQLSKEVLTLGGTLEKAATEYSITELRGMIKSLTPKKKKGRKPKKAVAQAEADHEAAVEELGKRHGGE